MVSSTLLLMTIRKLALLIIANVLQRKCQCGLKAFRYSRGSDAGFVLLEELLIKRLLWKWAAAADRYDSGCSLLSFGKVCMTPLERIWWKFNVAGGQMGHYAFMLGGVGWRGVYNLYRHHTFSIFLSSRCYNNQSFWLKWPWAGQRALTCFSYAVQQLNQRHSGATE